MSPFKCPTRKGVHTEEDECKEDLQVTVKSTDTGKYAERIHNGRIFTV